MRILSVTAQKPHSTGSGYYLTETVRCFDSMGHTQGVVAGICPDDTVCFPEGVDFYPVYFNTPGLPFNIAGMSDEMPYPSTLYRNMTEEMAAAFRTAFETVLRQAVERLCPDVIICHHLYFLSAIVRELFPGIPVWGICHGTDLRQMHTNPFMREYIRTHISKLDKVCCLHDAQRQAVSDCYGIPYERTCVAGAGYNQDIFYDRNIRTPHEELRLVFAGKISDKKGIYCLLDALKSSGLPRGSVTLRMAGGWPSEEQRLRAMAAIADCGHNVTLLGPLNQQLLAHEFSLGDVFVLPSFSEGFPLVLAEAMACGMGAICTDLPGIRPRMEELCPGCPVDFIEPPVMLDPDTPDPHRLHEFTARLTDAILSAKRPSIPPDLSAFTWEGVCERILG